MDYASVLGILAALVTPVATYCLIWIYKRKRAHRFFEKHGISGPKPNFFYGSHDEVDGDDFKDTFDKWKKKYGNVYGYYAGDRPTIVLHDPEMIKQCLVKEAHAFYNRLAWPVTLEPFKSSLLSLRGLEWKNVRSVISPIFSTSKMKLLYNQINDSMNPLLEVVDQFAISGQPFDFFQNAKALTFDVITKVALAINVNAQKNPNHPLFVKLKHSVEVTLGRGSMRLFTAFPKMMKVISFFYKYTEDFKTIKYVVDNVAYVKEQRANDRGNRKMDFLQLLLEAQEETNLQSKETIVTNDHVISNSFVMFGAGYETTSTALAFSAHVLSTRPDIQEKLYREIKEKCPQKDELSYDDVNSLKYLDMFFSEVLRMYPPVTLFVTRDCTEDITVLGQFFPKGSVVQIPIYNLHHDSDLWTDPETFDPERFSDDNKGDIHPGAYLPFGIGPRICVGMRLAQNEAKLAIARLLLRYRILRCDKTQEPLQLINKVFLLNPKDGVFVRIEKRSN